MRGRGNGNACHGNTVKCYGCTVNILWQHTLRSMVRVTLQCVNMTHDCYSKTPPCVLQ